MTTARDLFVAITAPREPHRLDNPLRFEVRALDGRLLDSFTENELATVQSGHTEKSWHEAACWAHVAIAQDPYRKEAPPMSAEALLTVPLDQIEVDPGANPRAELGDVAGLAQSISIVGLLSPLTVRPKDGGGYVLVAGHRRHAALTLLGREEAPVLVRDTNGLTAAAAATAENVARVNLNPIEEARAFLAMIGGGMTQKGVAEATGQSERFVRERLRLLALPESAKLGIVEGAIPLSATPNLHVLCEKVPVELGELIGREVASGRGMLTRLTDDPTRLLATIVRDASSPQPLECTAEDCERGYLEGQEPDEPGEGATEEEIDAFENWEAPECPRCKGTGLEPDQPEWTPPSWVLLRDGVDVEEAYWLDDTTRAKLLEMVESAPWRQQPSFSDESLSQAVAGGYGFELTVTRGGRPQTFRYITDAAFARDRIVTDYQAWIDRNKSTPGAPYKPAYDDGGKVSRPVVPDTVGGEVFPVEEGETQAAYGKRARQHARNLNQKLADRFVAKLEEVPVTKDSAMLLAGLVLQLLDSPAAYARLVRPEWQEVERTKRGTEKVTYPEGVEAAEKLWQWLGRATTPEQILGRLVQVLAAVRYAEQGELARSKRVYGSRWPSAHGRSKSAPDVDRLLAKVAKPGIGSAKPTRS